MQNTTLQTEGISATLVAIAKNESNYILEWVAYHLSIGFDRIIVFDNDSKDNTGSILNIISKSDVRIQVIHWPSQSGASPQMSAYNYAMHLLETPWVSFLDIDEFFVPFQDGSIKAFLNRVPKDVSSVHINWLGFGSGGIIDPNYQFVTEVFTQACPVKWANNHHYKTIARTKEILDVYIHDVEISKGRRVLSDFCEFRSINKGLSNRITHQGVQINHYQCKTYPEFKSRMRRGDANYPPDHPLNFRDGSFERFKQLDLNENPDRKIGQFFSALKKEYDSLCVRL